MTASLTTAELKSLAKDVGYELQMVAAVGPMATGPGLDVVGYALLETSMLHVRNLDDFLRSEVAAEDDVIALDYLPAWPPQAILTDSERDDINKRLMHISRRRLQPHAHWDRLEIAGRTMRGFEAFHAALRSTYPRRAKWFDEAVDAAKVLFARPLGLGLS